MINFQRKLELLHNLKEWLQTQPAELQVAKLEAEKQNPWFTQHAIQHAIEAICEEYLDIAKINAWLKRYPGVTSEFHQNGKLKVAMVFPGNIPMAGFHDFLCGFLSGHRLVCKLSNKDQILLTAIFEFLVNREPLLAENLHWTERKLGDFDAVIATGSNNTGRYFKQYFGGYPNIIRGHRNSIAVLHGDESSDEIQLLAKDVFHYFGLGCRNVTKIYVPENYDFENFLKHLKYNPDPADHHKYRNNYDYKLAVKMINRELYMSNSQIILSESENMDGGISMLLFEYYSSQKDLADKINMMLPNIQCIVSSKEIEPHHVTQPGNAQNPQLWDYADFEDTIEFLLNLHKKIVL